MAQNETNKAKAKLNSVFLSVVVLLLCFLLVSCSAGQTASSLVNQISLESSGNALAAASATVAEPTASAPLIASTSPQSAAPVTASPAPAEPAAAPTESPTPAPTPEPTATPAPAPKPTPKPTPKPARKPAPQKTAARTVAPTEKPTPGPTGTAAPSGSMKAQENQMIALVNGEREKVGLKALKYDSSLRAGALKHSKDMSANDFFSHTSPTNGSFTQRLSASGVSYSTAGENIAMYGSVSAAHKALMNSEGHRANILGEKFTRIGIGIVYNAERKVYYITQWFAG